LLAWAAHERPGATALIEHILSLEAAHKLEQRIIRRIDTSGLVERKSLEAFDWDFQPTLDKALVLELARLDFVRSHDDLVVTGSNGTGKSHLLKAFGLRACEQGIRMRYARCVDLCPRPPRWPRRRHLRPSPQGLGAPGLLDHRRRGPGPGQAARR
jgi:DNA replication protein DnaC